MVVVFPLPFTPTTSMTQGLPSPASMGVCTPWRIPVISVRSTSRSASGPVSPPFQAARTLSSILVVVSIPTSAINNASSRSSIRASSMGRPNRSRNARGRAGQSGRDPCESGWGCRRFLFALGFFDGLRLGGLGLLLLDLWCGRADAHLRWSSHPAEGESGTQSQHQRHRAGTDPLEDLRVGFRCGLGRIRLDLDGLRDRFGRGLWSRFRDRRGFRRWLCRRFDGRGGRLGFGGLWDRSVLRIGHQFLGRAP